MLATWIIVAGCSLPKEKNVFYFSGKWIISSWLTCWEGSWSGPTPVPRRRSDSARTLCQVCPETGEECGVGSVPAPVGAWAQAFPSLPSYGNLGLSLISLRCFFLLIKCREEPVWPLCHGNWLLLFELCFSRVIVSSCCSNKRLIFSKERLFTVQPRWPWILVWTGCRHWKSRWQVMRQEKRWPLDFWSPRSGECVLRR